MFLPWNFQFVKELLLLKRKQWKYWRENYNNLYVKIPPNKIIPGLVSKSTALKRSLKWGVSCNKMWNVNLFGWIEIFASHTEAWSWWQWNISLKHIILKKKKKKVCHQILEYFIKILWCANSRYNIYLKLYSLLMW
jgi:hypothetical protein